VLVDNLGPQRLMKGYITSDPVIVALLDTQDEVELVREVKDKC
jgi:nucleoside diphosphate kinase